VLVDEFPTKTKLAENKTNQVSTEKPETFFDAVEYQE
jgi:hypothetical protein